MESKKIISKFILCTFLFGLISCSSGGNSKSAQVEENLNPTPADSVPVTILPVPSDSLFFPTDSLLPPADSLTANPDSLVIDSSLLNSADTVWNRAQLTWYESYPDPGSEECIEYNGCTWAGWFAGLPDQQTEEWVKQNNIIAVHEKDFEKYVLKTFRLRKNNLTIDAVVYDMCSDADCDGCCTKNAGSTGFLIDIEKYSLERFGGLSNGHGIVQWTCLDCE